MNEEQLFSPKYFSSNSKLSLANGSLLDFYLGYPGYYSSWETEEDSTLSKDSIWDVTDLHFELIDKWQMFFDHVGAYKWHGIVEFKKEIIHRKHFSLRGNLLMGLQKQQANKAFLSME